MNQMNEHNEKSISIYELYVLLKRYVLVILTAGLIGGLLTYCACRLFIEPVYEASAKMIVNSRQEQNGTLTNDQITSSQKLVDTYAIIIRSHPVLEPVIKKLNLSMDAEVLARKVAVTSVNDTQVMQISVQSKDPDQALKILQEIVNTCPDVIIEAVQAGSVKTIEPAYLKKAPIVPSTNLFTVVAAFLCMVAVVIFVVLRFLLDNTYKSDVDLRNDLGVPVLGVIPNFGCCLKQKYDSKEGPYYGKA
jgi:capsular polysaccharide biosynthesis protein